MANEKLVVLTGRDYTDERSREQKTAWTRIGAAWKSDKNPDSISVVLDALPVNGKMLIKVDTPREERDNKGGGDNRRDDRR
jgi:hypothetical protein